MPVEPCGYAEIPVGVLGIVLDDAERGLQITGILLHGSGFQSGERLHEIRFVASCHPCTEPGCLHGSASASGNHQRALFGEGLADACHLFVRGIVASHGIASHHSHHLALVIFCKQTSCALHDAEVVQIACQGLKRVVCHLALSQKMIVDLLVIAQGKSFGACKVKPCVQRFRRI